MHLDAFRRAIFMAMPLLAGYVVLTTVAGTVLRYSPVPYGDMWNGTVGFLAQVRAGDHAVWWAQHNEHRIVLARLVFFLDQRLFGGLSVLPFTANLACALVATVILGVATKRLASVHQRPLLEAVAAFSLAASMSFSWIQSENFIWAFQSSFFMAYVLPLSALLLLAWSSEKHGYFSMAVLLGVLSAGTLANGVLALPLMFLLSFFCKTSKWQRMTLALLSVLVPILYFHSFHSHAGHDSMMTALVRDPVGLLRYVFIYLGAPVYHLVGLGQGGLVVAELSGVLMTLLSAWALHAVFRQNLQDKTAIALLAFIGFVMVSALATAGGRLSFGLGQAVAGRYATPTLLAWACLWIVLWAPQRTGTRCRSVVPLLFMTATSAALAVQQPAAMQPAEEELSARRMAGLALALGIRDEESILRVFPDASYALSVSRIALRNQLSIFGHDPYRHAARQMGRKMPLKELPVCKGGVTKIEPLGKDPRYVRIAGWVQIGHDKTPTSFALTSPDNLRVGLGMTFIPNPDAARHTPQGVHNSFFRGYVLTQASTGPLGIVVESDICRATVDDQPSAMKHP